MSQVRSVVTVAEVVFVLNSTGGSPITLRFSDRPFTDRSAGWVAEASLVTLPTVEMSRVQGTRLRGPSLPDGSELEAVPSVATRQTLAARNCERQSLKWWRVDRDVETLTGVTPEFDGLASGHELSDSRLLILAFSVAKLFDAPVQSAKWKGRGAAVKFTSEESTIDPGNIRIEKTTGGDYGPITRSLTLEVGFTPSAFPGAFDPDSHLAALGITAYVFFDASDSSELKFNYTPSGGPAVVADSGWTPLVDTRYHAVGQWTGAVAQVGVDGSWLGSSPAATVAPTSVGNDFWIGSLIAGAPSTALRYFGEIDFVRLWADYLPTWAELTAFQNRPVPSALQEFVLVEALLNEGLWTQVSDDTRGLSGSLDSLCQWVPTNTGDLSLRGKRKPWALGYVPNAPAQLIHATFQRWAVSGGEVEAAIPRLGARRMQKSLSWASLTLTFDEATKTIKDHRSGNAEWSELLAGAVVRVTGTASNNKDHRLSRDAFQVGDFYFVELADPPADEASVVSTLIETVSSFTVESASAAGTVDFSTTDRTITAKTGQDFGDFDRYREITVAGSTDNDGTRSFTVETDTYLVSDEWVLKVNPAPIDGVGDTGVSVSQEIDIGEYEDSAADLALGQFQLNFEPTKAVTCELYGEVTASVTPLTVADQIKWVLDNGPPAVQAIPYSTGRLATMARKFPQLSGIAQGLDETLTIGQVLDTLAQSIGAHWWINRQGGFEMLDWPFVARNPVPIDQALLDSSGATGDAVDLQDDPDTGAATTAGVVLTNPASGSYLLAEVDQVERLYVDTFLVRIAAKGSKTTVTMQVDAYENVTLKAALGTAEVDTTEAVFEFTLDTDDLTDDSGGKVLAIRIENSETDGSSLTVGAVEFVPTWKTTTIGPEDVYLPGIEADPSVKGAGAVQLLYSVNKAPLSAGDVSLAVQADRSAAGREALERATHAALVASWPDEPDDEAEVLTLETALVNGEDAEEVAERIFAGSGTNTFVALTVPAATLEALDPFFRVLRWSTGWKGVLSGVTDDVDVVQIEEQDVGAALRVVMVGRVL